MSQQFLRRSKDRRLGLEPNSFSFGRQTHAWDSSRLGLEPNSFSVGRRTNVCDSIQLGIEQNSFSVGRRTDVWDSSHLGLESINSFGHILCKEDPCPIVVGTRELTLVVVRGRSKVTSINTVRGPGAVVVRCLMYDDSRAWRCF